MQCQGEFCLQNTVISSGRGIILEISFHLKKCSVGPPLTQVFYRFRLFTYVYCLFRLDCIFSYLQYIVYFDSSMYSILSISYILTISSIYSTVSIRHCTCLFHPFTAQCLLDTVHVYFIHLHHSVY